MNKTKTVTNIKKSNFKHWLNNAGKAALVATIISTSGCMSKTKSIGDEYTISDVVNAIEDKTLMDENLEAITLKFNDNNYTFKEACNGYRNARSTNDTILCNIYLQILDKMVFISKLFDALGIDMNTLKSYDVDIKEGYANVTYTVEKSKVVPGNIVAPYDETVEKKYELKGLAYDLSLNYARAKNRALEIDQKDKDINLDVDDHYRALRRVAVGDSKIKKNYFKVSSPTKETIEILEDADIVKKRTK